MHYMVLKHLWGRHSGIQGFLSQEDCSRQTCPNACLHVAVNGLSVCVASNFQIQVPPLSRCSLACLPSTVNNEKSLKQQQQTGTTTSTVTWYITEHARGPSRLISTYLTSFSIIQSNQIRCCIIYTCRSLEELKRYGNTPACHLVEVMFGGTLPSQISPDFTQWLDCGMEPTASVSPGSPGFSPQRVDVMKSREVFD